jgi:hypothetical protein
LGDGSWRRKRQHNDVRGDLYEDGFEGGGEVPGSGNERGKRHEAGYEHMDFVDCMRESK